MLCANEECAAATRNEPPLRIPTSWIVRNSPFRLAKLSGRVPSSLARSERRRSSSGPISRFAPNGVVGASGRDA